MKRFLPRLRILRTIGTDPTTPEEPEVEGWSIIVSWLGFVAEAAIARRT